MATKTTPTAKRRNPPAAEAPPPAPPADAIAAVPPPLCAIFRRFLRKHGLKFTVERAVILDAVLSEEGVFEADTIADRVASATPPVSRATVYRTLKHLTEAGIIDEIVLDARQSHYRVGYGRPPSGQVAVSNTGEVIDFPLDAIEDMVKAVCEEHGVEPISCRLVIHASRPTDDDDG
ncbi:MAG: Fur family transcriptional regulator [Planctomycetota bacterium]